MDAKPLPDPDAYPLATPINFYKRGFDAISEHWYATESYAGAEPGSAEFELYVVWRMNLVIWTCCTIESCVNLEGVSWMGEEYYKDTIERLRIRQKLRLLYAMEHQEQLPRDHDVVKKAERVFEVRNQYIHPKTRGTGDNAQNAGKQNFERLDTYGPDDLWDLVQCVNGLFRDRDAEAEDECSAPE